MGLSGSALFLLRHVLGCAVSISKMSAVLIEIISTSIGFVGSPTSGVLLCKRKNSIES